MTWLLIAIAAHAHVSLRPRRRDHRRLVRASASRCAKHLAREGVAVVLGARRVDRCDEAAAASAPPAGARESSQMDVTREADVLALVARARARFGRLDVMICNAGFGYYGTVDETPPTSCSGMMDVNFMGTFYGARAALPIFRAQGSGQCIFISSIVGRRGIALMGGYTATKAAQAGFAESLRAEFAGTDIHVSVVFPISTSTEFRDAMERDFGHAVGGLGPKQSVDDVARAIVALHPAGRAPEVYPHAVSRALAILNAVGARVHRPVRAQVRPAPRGRRESGGAPTDSGSTLSTLATAIAAARARRRRPRAGRRRLGARPPARPAVEGYRPRGLRRPRRRGCASCSRRSAA